MFYLIILTIINIAVSVSLSTNQNLERGFSIQKFATIRKCCPESYTFVNYTCKKTNIPLNVKNLDKYNIIYGYKCKADEIYVEPYTDEYFNLTRNGDIVVAIAEKTVITKKFADYCLEHVWEFNRLVALLCTEVGEENELNSYGE